MATFLGLCRAPEIKELLKSLANCLKTYSSLCVTSNTSHEPPEGNNLLVGDHVLQILGGAVQGHSLDGLGCLPRVLEVNPEVGALGLSRLGGIIRFDSLATRGFCKNRH